MKKRRRIQYIPAADCRNKFTVNHANKTTTATTITTKFSTWKNNFFKAIFFKYSIQLEDFSRICTEKK